MPSAKKLQWAAVTATLLTLVLTACTEPKNAEQTQEQAKLIQQVETLISDKALLEAQIAALQQISTSQASAVSSSVIPKPLIDENIAANELQLKYQTLQNKHGELEQRFKLLNQRYANDNVEFLLSRKNIREQSQHLADCRSQSTESDGKYAFIADQYQQVLGKLKGARLEIAACGGVEPQQTLQEKSN